MSRFKKQLCASFKVELEGGKARILEGSAPILAAFNALSRGRSYNRYGPNPIAWESLAAWSRIMRVPIEPHHADIIMALDEVWLEHVMSHGGSAPSGVKALPKISDQPLTAALFDVTAG